MDENQVRSIAPDSGFYNLTGVDWNTLYVLNGEYLVVAENSFGGDSSRTSKTVFVENPLLNQILKVDLPPMVQNAVGTGVVIGAIFSCLFIIIRRKRSESSEVVHKSEQVKRFDVNSFDWDELLED